MKLSDLLLEAKFSKQKTLLYHATNIKNLLSIIRNGLIINKNSDGYGSNTGQLYSLKPLESLYFTQSFKKAVSIGTGIGQTSLIVAVEAQPQEAFADEDNILDILNARDKLADLYQTVRSKINPKQISDGRVVISQYVTPFTDRIISDFTSKHQIDPRALNLLHDNLNKMFIELCYSKVFNERVEIREYQDKITKLLKSYIGTSNNIRISKNIGFTGSTKIVGLLVPDKDVLWWESQVSNPMKGYPKQYDTPMELFNKINGQKPNGY